VQRRRDAKSIIIFWNLGSKNHKSKKEAERANCLLMMRRLRAVASRAAARHPLPANSRWITGSHTTPAGQVAQSL